MNKILIGIAAAAAIVTLPFTAAAHTPVVSANCQGVTVNLTSYEGPSSNNKLTVFIDGGAPYFVNFGSSYSFTYPVPQNGATSSWSVTIDANLNTGNATAYDKTFTGRVGPCGTATTLPPVTTVPPCTDCVINTVSVTPPSTFPPCDEGFEPDGVTCAGPAIPPGPINDPATVTTTTAATTTTTTVVSDIGTPPTFPEPVGTEFTPPTQTLPETGNNIEIISFASTLILVGLLATWIAHRRSRPDHEGDNL